MTKPGRLSKRQAEALLADFDRSPQAALTAALRSVTGVEHGDFVQLVACCDFSAERRARLVAGDPAALDELARELNELRTVPFTRRSS